MKKKPPILFGAFLLVIVAVFGLFTYQHHQKQEKAKQEPWYSPLEKQ